MPMLFRAPFGQAPELKGRPQLALFVLGMASTRALQIGLDFPQRLARFLLYFSIHLSCFMLMPVVMMEDCML